MKVGILVPVWRGYTWVAPLTFELISEFWPSHPEIVFCGLAGDESAGLPRVDLDAGVDRRNWTAVLQTGVAGMKARGFEAVYVVAEEHVPLATCHAEHLNNTLPKLLQSLKASYISLMGWDNRRYPSRSPVLDAEHYRLKHLVGTHDARFHLHPALWRLDVLEACCELALRVTEKRGSAWHFEKACAPLAADLLDEWKQGCFQINSAAMSLTVRNGLGTARAELEAWVFHKLMALYPVVGQMGLARQLLGRIPFDDVFCNGPYPLFFSGIMAKGEPNQFFVNYVSRHSPELMGRILERMPTR